MIEPPSLSRRRDRFILLSLMGVGLLLRCWGIGFGLPGIRARPDEEFAEVQLKLGALRCATPS